MNRQRGSTLMEMLVVLVIMGLGLGAVTVYLKPVDSPLKAASTLVEGVCRQARLNAIATTSAYRVRPDSSSNLLAEKAASCAATSWTVDDSTKTDLPKGVTLDSTSWTVCFGSRGVSTDNQEIWMSHPDYGSVGVEVLLGGTTRIIE